MAACSLHAFFGLLATFPILGLTLLLGGVTGPEFTRLMLVFAVTLFFSLGIGMFVSAVSNESRQAMTRALLLIIVFAALFPAVWAGFVLRAAYYQNGSAATAMISEHQAFLLPSPIYTYIAAFDSQYRYGTGTSHFWWSLGTLFALGLGGIVFAGLSLPRAWRGLGGGTGGRTTANRRRFFGGMSPTRRAALLKWNPVYWLTVRETGPRRGLWWLLVVLVPAWGICWVATIFPDTTGRLYEPQVPFIISMLVAYLIHAVVKVLVATEASRRLNQDRQSGALEILLGTPVSVALILRGQKRALWHHFRWPFLALGLINLGLWLAAMNSDQMHMNARDKIAFSELFLGGIVVLLTDFYALGWVGMWRGLVTTKHPRAVAGTVGRVLGPGWLAMFLLFVVQPSFRGPDAPIYVFAAWLFIGVVVDAIFGMIARYRLRVEFRRVAAEGGRKRAVLPAAA